VRRDRWASITELFHAALEWPQEQRSTFVEEHCYGDEQLRQEIASLLTYEESAQRFLNQPAMQVAARLIAHPCPELKLQAGDQIGCYRILELLGIGGMGEVYKASDARLGRLVALKLITRSAFPSSEVSERFLREARAASALNHPNICTVYDVGDHGGEPFLVMELLEGAPLSKLIAGGPLAPDQLLPLAIQIAGGLETAHARGIIHRDIKPQNIFITGRGQAKILDFGVAKLMAEHISAAEHGSLDTSLFGPLLTTCGSHPGTPGYMSPEQTTGEELDPRSDLFSFGIVLYEMATGQRLFSATFSSPIPATAATVSAAAGKQCIPRPLAPIIGKLLQTELRNRYQSASELIADLRGLEEKRGRRPMTVVAGLLLALSMFAAITYFAFKRVQAPVASRTEWLQITNFSDSVVDPSISRDGTELAFVRGPRTFTPVGQVYTMRLPDGEPHCLTNDDRMKMGPVFSPDSSRIAYTRIDQNWNWDTWAVSASGLEPRPLMPNASGLTWIGPHRVLFSQMKIGIHMAIATSDERRNGLREIYLPTSVDGMAHRSYPSPDARWLLLTEMDGTGWLPCRLVPFDGSSRGRQVGPPNASCTSAAWSPDGKWMYFSSDRGGAFHLWREQFPSGSPHQLTFGPTEEEGIAMSPDGHSLITSVGTGISTVWIHDKDGERPLSEQGFSFSPQFSRDGAAVYYLVSQRPRAFLAETGDLWRMDRLSGKARRLPVPEEIESFAVVPERNQVFFVRADSKNNNALWVSGLDDSHRPRKLAEDVFRGFNLSHDQIAFATRDGKFSIIGLDGANRREVSANSASGALGISPDGKWLVVTDRTAVNGIRIPKFLYPLVKGTSSPIPLCGVCSISWIFGGRYLRVRFGGDTDAEDRVNYVIPVPRGEILPPIFRKGHFVSQDEVSRLPGVRVIRAGAPSFGPDLETYVYTKRTMHRNLFRIPLE
jgi:serine/threonine protein kinase/Tol biopolymer transport system component